MGRRSWFALLVMLLWLPNSCLAVSVTSGFGWRVHPVTGQYKFHTGTDLGYGYGEDVRAVLPGRVAYCYWWGGYGNCIILAHADGDHTLYGHLSGILVSYGQEVAKGQVIGRAGSTGLTTGPHLHLEWWHNGTYMDPLPLFYANEIQNIEFYKEAGETGNTGGNSPPSVPLLPTIQGEVKVPEDQMEKAEAQLRETFEFRTKEKKENLFFE